MKSDGQSENKLSLCHGGNSKKYLLKSDNLFSRDEISSQVQALDLRLLESISKLLYIVHDDQVVGYIQVSEAVLVLSPDQLFELDGSLSRALSVGKMSNFQGLSGVESLGDKFTTCVSNRVITHAEFFKALVNREKLSNGFSSITS